jgi:hypothetical protein
MPKLVIATATLQCSFGTAASAFQVVAHGKTAGEKRSIATVEDHGGDHIKSFTLCTSPSNPAVAAAKAPQPCAPIVNGPWKPGSPAVKVAGQKALTDDSTCSCQWGGTIRVADAGQATVFAGDEAPQGFDAQGGASKSTRRRLVRAARAGRASPARRDGPRPRATEEEDVMSIAFLLDDDHDADHPRYVLESEDGAYRQERSPKDDLVQGDRYLQLQFGKLLAGKKYKLTKWLDPECAQVVFEGAPYDFIVDQPRSAPHDLGETRYARLGGPPARAEEPPRSGEAADA